MAGARAPRPDTSAMSAIAMSFRDVGRGLLRRLVGRRVVVAAEFVAQAKADDVGIRMNVARAAAHHAAPTLQRAEMALAVEPHVLVLEPPDPPVVQDALEAATQVPAVVAVGGQRCVGARGGIDGAGVDAGRCKAGREEEQPVLVGDAEPRADREQAVETALAGPVGVAQEAGLRAAGRRRAPIAGRAASGPACSFPSLPIPRPAAI